MFCGHSRRVKLWTVARMRLAQQMSVHFEADYIGVWDGQPTVWGSQASATTMA